MGLIWALCPTKANNCNPAVNKYINPGNVATVSTYISWNNEPVIKKATELAIPVNVNILPYSVGSTIFDIRDRKGVASKPPSTVRADA